MAILLFLGASCAGTDPSDPLTPVEIANELTNLEKRALRRPDDPIALSDLGVALYVVGKEERALPLLRTALLYDPTRLSAALVVTIEDWKERRLGEAAELLEIQRPVTPLERRLLRSFQWQISDAAAREQAVEVARARTAGILDAADSIVVFDFDTVGGSREIQAIALATTELFRAGLRRHLGDRLRFDPWARHVRQSLERLDRGEGRRVVVGPLGSITGVSGVQNRLRILLDSKGNPFYGGESDGVFGRATVESIRRFQSENRLPVDGIVGPATRAAMERQVARKFVQAPPVARSSMSAEGARLAGVRYLFAGRLSQSEDGHIQVHLDWVDSLDDAVIHSWVSVVPGSDVGRLSADLLQQVLPHPLWGDSTLGASTTSLAVMGLGAPLDSLEFVSFGEGLRQERLGRWSDAAAQYATLLQRSPQFRPASQASQRLAMHSEDWTRFLNISVRNALSR